MLVIKMMSGENLPDSDTRKSFRIFTATNFEFNRAFNHPHLLIFSEDGEQSYHQITGNCYVMDCGKTIATFAHLAITPTEASIT